MAQEWEYDGVDLTTLAYNVQWLGAPLNVPPRRGENVVVPSRTGRLYVAKRPDQRTATLAMWVQNIHPTTGGAGSEAQMRANLDTLRGLFARDGQHTLKHQFGGVIRTATAEVVATIDFEPKGLDSAYTFVVEFLLADPWWYAESLTTVGPTAITQSPQNITVTNGGTYKVEQAIITVTGPITNPKFAVGSIWVQYTGTVGSGETLVIDCGDWTAELDGADVSGNISHAGALRWLEFAVGGNTLAVTSSGYGGGTTVTVAFYAPYV